MSAFRPRALVSRAQARALDRALIDGGVPGILLMENAGRAATDLLIREFPGQLDRIFVFGGLGQNGGDAWVLARHLAARGLAPRVFVIGDAQRISGDARIALEALRAIGVIPEPITNDAELESLERRHAEATLLVDGLFGTGLDRPLEGIARAAVRALDAWSVPRLALDLPSGLSCDTGQPLGAALRADVTVTFHADKRGLNVSRALDLVGRVVVVDIGVAPPPPIDAFLVGAGELARTARARSLGAHKGLAGHVLVVAGAEGRTGAAILAGLGAMRAGAGLVTLAARGRAHAALDAKVVELMTRRLPDGVEASVADALGAARAAQSLVVGPGIGLDDETRAFARRLAVSLAPPTVLDADALRAIGADLGLLREAAGPRVLTPHPGEAASLLGVSVREVEADRFGAADALARRSGQIVVLKGARSIVAATLGGETRFAVCDRGTPALAVAGTGDVLAGAIGGLLAQEAPTCLEDAFTASWRAVVAHALAAEEASAGRDRGLVAREVADALPRALAEATPRPRALTR